MSGSTRRAIRPIATTTKPPARRSGCSTPLADNWGAIGPCRDYIARRKAGGADASLTEYPDATLGYDAFLLKEPLNLPNAQTGRNCFLKEDDNGVILNAKTGNPFTLDDAFIERGAQIAYNPAATEAAKALKANLTATFKLE